MKHVIWNNDVCEMAESLKGDEAYEGMSGEDIYQTASEEIDTWFDAEQTNLDIEMPGEIYLVGNLVRWNGSAAVHKGLSTKNIGEALSAALSSFGGDNSFEIYVEDGKLMISQYGHDNPVSPSVMEFRALIKDYWDVDVHSTETMLEISQSLGDKIAEIYGW